uniref:Uncharacterized protein n=1 Tax=Haemonchus contortus TaxID=6289 RepID=A0A7I4Z4J7_HAECO
MTKLTPNPVGWKAARLLLAGDVQVSGYDYPDQHAITVTVAGPQIKLNADQVNAVNMYNKEFPIQIVDSAYGADSRRADRMGGAGGEDADGNSNTGAAPGTVGRPSLTPFSL